MTACGIFVTPSLILQPDQLLRRATAYGIVVTPSLILQPDQLLRCATAYGIVVTPSLTLQPDQFLQRATAFAQVVIPDLTLQPYQPLQRATAFCLVVIPNYLTAWPAPLNGQSHPPITDIPTKQDVCNREVYPASPAPAACDCLWPVSNTKLNPSSWPASPAPQCMSAFGLIVIPILSLEPGLACSCKVQFPLAWF